MMRNDYRRSLILLRSDGSGCSGHVRLERRTLMGSMYFLVQTPPECAPLRAALVGRSRSGYYACSLGEMQRDSRGQAVLGYSFDPRNICGRELEQYQLITVNCGDGDACRIVLYGNVCGHAELDWDQVRAAVCALDTAKPAREIPATELPPVEEVPEEAQSEVQMEAQTIEGEPEDAAADAAPESQNAAEIARQEESPVAETGTLPEETQARQPAAELLDADFSLPWPDSVEQLRLLLMTELPLENPPDDAVVYIAAPMPEESGFDFCAAGVRIENGQPVSVRYAMPAAWTAEAPAGLEDYAWVGDGNRGWWVTEAPVED